jgi:hypothetical protein
MKSEELEDRLTRWSCANSGRDERRGYIGLSGISDCPRVIYERFFNHIPISPREALRTRLSYEIEESIKNRLRAMGIYGEGKEIKLHGGLAQGHTKGEIDGDLLEIATVPLEEYLPEDMVPTRKYWQIQSYLHYGGYTDAQVIYFARNSGDFKILNIAPNHSIIEKIERKVELVVRTVKEHKAPKCQCGKCT